MKLHLILPLIGATGLGCKTLDEASSTASTVPTTEQLPHDGPGQVVYLMGQEGSAASAMWHQAKLPSTGDGMGQAKTYHGPLVVYCSKDGAAPADAANLPAGLHWQCSIRVEQTAAAGSFPKAPFLSLDKGPAMALFEALAVEERWQSSLAVYEKRFTSDDAVFTCSRSLGSYRCSLVGKNKGDVDASPSTLLSGKIKFDGPSSEALYGAARLAETSDKSGKTSKTYQGPLRLYCLKQGDPPPQSQGLATEPSYRCGFKVDNGSHKGNAPEPAFAQIEGKSAAFLWQALKVDPSWHHGAYAYVKYVETDQGRLQCTKKVAIVSCSVE